jgi:hypothetical protein
MLSKMELVDPDPLELWLLGLLVVAAILTIPLTIWMARRSRRS